MHYEELLNRKLEMIFSLIIVLFLASNAFAFSNPPYISVQKPTPSATKTVCASGCDYQTLDAASSAAQPGWLIRVKAGTYTIPNGSDINWRASGTPGKEIVIAAYGNGGAIFNLQGDARFYIFGHDVIIDGGPNKQLIFDGNSGGAGQKIISPQTSATHVTLSRIVVRNNGGSNYSYPDTTRCNATNCGIEGVSDYFNVYNSEIYGCCSMAIYSSAGNYQEYRNNIVYNNKGTGIQVNTHGGASSDEIIVAGNVIYDNGAGGGMGGDRPGITLLSNDNSLYDVYVYNNLIWGNKEAGIKSSTYSNMAPRIYNNTIYNNKGYGMWLKKGPAYTVRNNISYANATGDVTAGTLSNNLIGSNPSFLSTSVTNSNYLKLSAGSTLAINKGYNLSNTLTTDFVGTIRDSLFDIGAFEYTSGGAGGVASNVPPAVPQELRKQ